MKVCFADQMRKIDAIAIENYGIPGVVLMENAAISCLDSISKYNKITIVCGKGNNAGDGFCIARHLINMGKDVTVYLALGDNFSGDALINYNILVKMGAVIKSCQEKDFDEDIASSECICDAIFGTGFKGTMTSSVEHIISSINDSRAYVLAIDIPSGVEADSGKVSGTAVKADKTVTFAAYKAGLLLYPGADYAGEIEVSDISIPKDATKDVGISTITKEDFLQLVPKRCKNSHKGDYGKIFIIGGSKGMAGAVSLAARAAFRVGAGLVTACVPHEINDIIQCTVEEATVFGADFKNEQEKIVEKMQGFDAILFGNGIGREEHITELARVVLENAKRPVVVDADGLFALSKKPELLSSFGKKLILTPHSMEFARLLGVDVEAVEENRLSLSSEFSKKYGVTLVLKGNHTIITTPELQYINMTGNSGMATAGSGDVLAGIMAGFVPVVKSPSDCARLSVYMHGAAGDYQTRRLSESSLTAGDIIDGIAHIFPVEK